MERMTKAATVTATTEQGQFTAIVSTYSVDRVGDQIVHGAFAKTIERWRSSGKRIPLHWDHKGEAHNIIGWVDPTTLEEIDGVGLQGSGQLDITDSETAREAWRSMKNNSMSLSFGYLVSKSKKRKDGITELHEIDLFEVSIVPVPANPDTRILSLKNADQLETELQEAKRLLAETRQELDALRKQADETGKEPLARSVDPLRRQADEVALEFATDGLPRKSPTPKVEQPRELVPLKDLKRRMRDEMLTHLSGEPHE